MTDSSYTIRAQYGVYKDSSYTNPPVTAVHVDVPSNNYTDSAFSILYEYLHEQYPDAQDV